MCVNTLIIDCSSSVVVLLCFLNISMQAWMPSSFGMLVYRLFTSMVTRMKLFVSFLLNVNILLKKSVVPWTYKTGPKTGYLLSVIKSQSGKCITWKVNSNLKKWSQKGQLMKVSLSSFSVLSNEFFAWSTPQWPFCFDKFDCFLKGTDSKAQES